jgi:DNA invertase Pin-like site-specific DNA recombinase
MRVLVAARLSQMADGKTGLETQDAEMVKWAAREGHEVVHVAADVATGKSDPWDRKNLRPWVTQPTLINSYDAVVAYRFDRLSRGNDASTSAIETWARDNGKRLLTEDGLEYPCEGVAGIRWDITKRISHEEWLKTSERYTRSGNFLRENGFHVGRVPFGYRTVVLPGEDHKRLTPEPAEAAIVRDVCEWYLDGASLGDICETLNSAGRLPRIMKNGSQPLWAPSTISKVLHNEVIAGRQKDGNDRTVAKVEPAVSRDIWEAVIARLAKRTKRQGISQTKSPALLTSIIHCSMCNKPMYRSGTPRNRYYYCRIKGCASIIRVDVADADVHAAMSIDDRRDIVETIVPGTGHDEAIADVKRDLAEAVEAEEFERIPALRSALAELRALPASPTRVIRRESDQTVAQMWADMPDDASRRAYLLERGARAVFSKDEAGHARLMLSVGQPQEV